jgi:sugar O-acyltransferase (sialic acid O-acetyltransferase NeuD family)
MRPMHEAAEGVCVILGGGGHARVLIDSLQLMGSVLIHGVLDPNPTLWGTTLLDVPILGGDDMLVGLTERGVNRFVVGLGGASDNRPRERLFQLARAHSLTPITVIHPAAIVSRWAIIGAGSQVLPTATLNAGAQLGCGVIVNSGGIVEHDCEIGDYVHVASGAILASAVRVGRRAHIGAGATIRQGIVIADDAVVGAGAVVVKNVSPGEVVVGVPARPFRSTQRSA